jgi:hypothetical protein
MGLGITSAFFLKDTYLSSALASETEILLLGGHTKNLAYQGPKGDHYFVLFDLKQNTERRAKLSHNVHSVTVDKSKRNAFCFSKEDKLLTTVNLPTMSIGTTSEAIDGHVFSGHGCLTPDGKKILTAEVKKPGEGGTISVRDVETLKVEGVFDSGGRYPHEIVFIDEGSFFVCNGESPSNLAIFSWPSCKLEKLISSSRPEQLLRHIAVTDDGNYCSAPLVAYNADTSKVKNPVALAYGNIKQGSINFVEIPVGWMGNAVSKPSQLLSVAWSKALGTCILTCKESDLVLSCDPRNGEVSIFSQLKQPRGVAIDEEGKVWITSGGVSLVGKNLKKQRVKEFKLDMNGAHMTFVNSEDL